MTDKSIIVQGLSLTQWEAMFRDGMPEYAATTFAFTAEAMELVRVVFGNQGPADAEGLRSPHYTHALTLPPSAAVALAHMLLKHYAEPVNDRSKSSGEL
jgi:hypothetical protein